jgi:anti-sigma regulatory factor (Ser/Thr protein kinase)
MTRAHFEQELPRSFDAAWVARRSLVAWVGAELEADELHRAKLLSSELVNNAVVHGRGQILLRTNLNQERLLVEVIDEGDGFSWDSRGRGRSRGGLGLEIVDSEATRWGVRGGSTHVWFELARRRERR